VLAAPGCDGCRTFVQLTFSIDAARKTVKVATIPLARSASEGEQRSILENLMATTKPIITHIFPSELGWMALAWTDDRLLRFTFGLPSEAAAIASLEADGVFMTSETKSVPAWVAKCAERLQSYAAGNEEHFDDVPLDLSHLSVFQARVVRNCRRIGRGKVRSYGELAKSAGSPGAARAVGSVMAKNRFPIIVPCHRVIGSGCSLGGFSARDGLNMKRRMLQLEGIELGKTRNTRRSQRGKKLTV
jgi:methylated-DNA-[protein]-cysteine S-methyltransferase